MRAPADFSRSNRAYTDLIMTPSEDRIEGSRFREVGLFGGLSDEVLDHLARTLHIARAAAGETLFSEGDVGAREMFVILEGEVEVVKKGRNGASSRVAILGYNDSFGEMSIIDMQARSATVRVLAPSLLARITREDLDALYRRDLRSYALVVLNVARDLSRRLRVATALIS
jgi:CRP-like cAMP-binding protein